MTAARVADLLLDMKVLQVSIEKPFTLTSGRASPVYVDCHKIISFPDARREIVGYAAGLLKDLPADCIAGGETAGIPYAAWISEALDKPMLYVRKKPKGFGRGAQVEGEMAEGARVILVEDLTTDGASKALFAEGLRRAGAVVTDIFSIFFYGTYPTSAKILGDAGLRLHALATWKDLLSAAARRGMLDAAARAEIERFLSDPEGWSQERLHAAG